MKNRPPQFEFNAAAEVFNLLVESALDGDRISRDIEKARTEAALARALEQKQQPQLL